ncbi:hypothetical protein KRIGEM_03048 (plasmid) [Komagataeibacter rhaeticus]|nr:hypothetical protein KRIGEM_03048 [Komagataeibacter rhaeticus]
MGFLGCACCQGLCLGRDLLRDRDDFHAGCVRSGLKIHLIDHVIKTVIVRTQGLKHLPDHLIGLVVIQSLVWLNPSRDNYGQYDIAPLLAWCDPHHTAHGLDHIHL